MTTKIEWTEHTWNPVTGCTKISAGCKHCYAATMANRLQAMKAPGYENGFELSLMPDRLDDPLKRKKPSTYFVCSMSDLFHESVPFEYIDQIRGAMLNAPQHTFQILTKRADRLYEYFTLGTRWIPDNAWIGVTVENRKEGIPRIEKLQEVGAKTRFLSIEPLLEDLGKLDLTGIHQVIVGGESGPKARIMKPEWVDNIFDQCQEQQVPFFFKQWGAFGQDGIKRSKQANGRTYKGQTWDGMPFSGGWSKKHG